MSDVKCQMPMSISMSMSMSMSIIEVEVGVSMIVSVWIIILAGRSPGDDDSKSESENQGETRHGSTRSEDDELQQRLKIVPVARSSALPYFASLDGSLSLFLSRISKIPIDTLWKGVSKDTRSPSLENCSSPPESFFFSDFFYFLKKP